MSGQSALSKGEMVVGKQGTSCVVYMDFNVGHVCLVRFFSEFVFYGLPAFKSRLLYFEVFVHSHWGHIQGSACRCLPCKPWWVKRLQKTHLTSKRQMLSSTKLRPRCAHFLFDKKHPPFFSLSFRLPTPGRLLPRCIFFMFFIQRLRVRLILEIVHCPIYIATGLWLARSGRGGEQWIACTCALSCFLCLITRTVLSGLQRHCLRLSPSPLLYLHSFMLLQSEVFFFLPTCQVSAHTKQK